MALAKAVDPARPLSFDEDEDFGEGAADADAAGGEGYYAVLIITIVGYIHFQL